MTIHEFANLAPVFSFALTVVATIGYLMGRRKGESTLNAETLWQELKRAKTAIREMEGISQHVRRSLASHHTNVQQFRDRLNELAESGEREACSELSEEAERLLKPTMRLATEMAQAYDEIRQQTSLLMTFTNVRTDPLTGLNNRHAMEEGLKTLFAMKTRYNTDFSIALIDIDHFKRLNDERGHLFGDQLLQQFSDLMDKSVRETDSVARYGGEEFVVIMPHTDLDGACTFAERFRAAIDESLPVSVSIGVSHALEDDSIQTLMTRVDTALYSAKSAGRNTVFRHDGQQIRLVDLPLPDSQDSEEVEKPSKRTIA
jgi:diguanylate cyclase (GGDEF)-like protein